MNRLIAFEGIEGCGKTTQIAMAGEYLAERGIECQLTQEPGGTPLGKKIREILLNIGSCPISPRAELLLFTAARAQHVEDVILPALERGRWVLCDRFLDATLAYQGYGRGLDIGAIKEMHDFAALSLIPGLTILLDLPAEEGLERALARIALLQKGVDREDRFERETLDFHRRIREGYLSLAAANPERYRIIDASLDAVTVHRAVREALVDFISKHG